MPGRLVLLDCSPRVAPGLLTASAWEDLRRADRVLAGGSDHPQLDALRHLGIEIEPNTEPDPVRLADLLLAAAPDAVVVWLLAPGGEPELTSALAARLVSPPTGTVEVEHQLGSYDLPGARLLDLVAVMDRLRSPGGCPWDAEQTHESLLRYLVEEAYEVVEAVETGDGEHLREELGDVLLQVLFHARIAAEQLDTGFTIDDVADGIVAKLVRRHPHVFADGAARTPGEVEVAWEQIKAAEKGRTSVLDGIPPGLPALSYAEKVLVRADRGGLTLAVPSPTGHDDVDPEIDSDERLGAALLGLVAEAHRLGVDPEAALRRAARGLASTARPSAQ